MPADPDGIVVGVGGAVIVGPAAVFSGVAAMTLGNVVTARADVAVAQTLAGRQGWVPWVEVVARVASFLKDGAVSLPLGTGRGVLDRVRCGSDQVV